MTHDPSAAAPPGIRARYCAPAQVLGFEFPYPPHYVESIAWAESDFEAGGDGHALTFLQVRDIPSEMQIIHRLTHQRLVPFARGANNDVLYCFDGLDPMKVLFVDLGEPRRTLQTAASTGYLGFLNAYRHNEGLAPWPPGQSVSD